MCWMHRDGVEVDGIGVDFMSDTFLEHRKNRRNIREGINPCAVMIKSRRHSFVSAMKVCQQNAHCIPSFSV